jgi:hypothetical protein
LPCAVTEVADRVGAVVGLVGVGPWVTVVEIASQHAVEEDGDLAGGGRDRLGLADAVGDAPPDSCP